MRVLLAIVAGVLTIGCTATKVHLRQPIVIGQPGVVYQTTDPEVAVDVVNNSGIAGDILVGQTLIYEGVQPGGVKTIGFFCNGLLVWDGGRRQLRRSGARNDYVRFVPQDPRYEVMSRNINVRCGQTQKYEFNVRTLRIVRVR